MKVVLGTFARGGIEALVGRDLPSGVLAALRNYTRREEAVRPAPKLARLGCGHQLGRSGAELELAVDPEIQEALEREARESSGVPVEQLAAHAVLVYLAHLDEVSGSEAHPLTRV